MSRRTFHNLAFLLACSAIGASCSPQPMANAVDWPGEMPPRPGSVAVVRGDDPEPQPQPAPPAPAPTLDVPPSVTAPAGRLARVPVVANCQTTWKLIGDADVFREWSADPLDLNLCLLGYQPGTVTVVVAGSSGSDAPPLLATCVVTFTGPAPPPEPPTPPTPPEPPAPPSPQAKSVWVVTVDAAMGRSVDLAQWYSDGAYWAQLTAAGHLWYHADVNNPAHEKYATIARQIGLPAVLIVDAATPHKLLKSLKLEGDRSAMAAAVTEAVTALTGGQ